MGIYVRYKNDPYGLLKFVQLLESLAPSRRQVLVDFGLKQEAPYTQKALRYLIEFHDLKTLPDMALAEVLYMAPSRLIALALYQESTDIKTLFAKQMPIKHLGSFQEDLKEVQAQSPSPVGARIRMVAIARDLCQKDLILPHKRVPIF